MIQTKQHYEEKIDRTIQDLIEKETREKLAKIDEYQKLISVREEFMDLTAE